MVAKSAFDEWQEAEDRRRERVADDAARAARRGNMHSIAPEVHRLIRENLGNACTEAGWQRAQTTADQAVMESADGFGALARMLARLSDRLTRIEARLGLLDQEEARRGE